MTVKLLVSSGAVVLSAVALAGNVCRWTGEAGDGKWSSLGNWEESVRPASGNDDVVYVPGGAKIDVDSASFSIGRLLIEGSGETLVTGGALSLDVTGIVLSNDTSTVTIENDLSVSQTSRFHTRRGNITVKGCVTIAASKTLYVETPDVNPQGTVLLLGGVNGPAATLNMRMGQNSSGTRLHHVWSSFNVKSFVVGGDYRTSRLVLHVGGQQWPEVTVGYGALIAMAPGQYCPTTVIRPNSYYSTGNFDLNGFGQTIDRIDPGTGTDNGMVQVVSAEPATLTMHATGNGSFNGKFTGRASFVWDPVDDYSFTMTNVSTTAGGLTVSNGTVVVGDPGSFASAKSLTVAAGATFSLTTGATGALAGLRDLMLDGTMEIGVDAVTPFNGVIVTVGANGKITVPAGMTVTVGAVRANGALVADATYETAAWLTPGGGSVKVDSTTLPTEFIWKDPVSGAWDAATRWWGEQAPNGSKNVSVTALGDDYAVTVPDGTSLARPLTVGNASGSGVASVVAGGAITMPGNSVLSVGRGGKVSVPADASLTVTGDSGTASATRVIDVTDGGELAVAGDMLVTNFYGRVNVSGGGRISVTDGSFRCYPYGSANGDVWDNRIEVGSGGTIDVSGGVFYPSIKLWGNGGIRFSGGDLNVSGTGRLRFKPDTQLLLGFGRISLSGDAVVDIENDGSAHVWTQAGGNESSLAVNGEILSIRVADRASFAFSKTLLCLGFDRWNVNASAVNEFIYESTATSAFNRFALGVINYRGSSVRAVLGSGRINVGMYGLFLSKPETAYLRKDSSVQTGGAVFSVTGGVLQVNGHYTEYAGLQIANALPWSVMLPNRLDGRLEISGGAVTNVLGSIALGSGNAMGTVRMTGGIFCSQNPRPAFFGVGDGEGRWEMTGGTATLNENVYLGIGETAVGLAYFTDESARAKFSFGKTLENCAKGVLDIEGGSFATASNIVCGVDGNHGEITVGAAGRIAARDLVMSNATDVITVRIDGTNGGAIALSGRLDVAAGVKLRILGAETIPEGTKPLTVLSFAETARTFDAADIEVADGVPVVQSSFGIKVGKPRGLAIIFR